MILNMTSLCHGLSWVFLCPGFDRAQKLQQEVNSNETIEVIFLKAPPKVMTKFFMCSLAHDTTMNFDIVDVGVLVKI